MRVAWGCCWDLPSGLWGGAPRPQASAEGGGGEGGEDTASGQWEQLTFYVGKGAEGSSGTAARLLHVVALGGFIDLEGQGRAEAAEAGAERARQAWRLQRGRVSLLSPPYSKRLL